MNKNSDVIYNAIGKRYVIHTCNDAIIEICHLTSSFTVLDLLVSLNGTTTSKWQYGFLTLYRLLVMRPPEGAYDDNALEVLGDLGYR